MAHLLARIVDADNIPVYSARNRITCTITGPARLLGIEDANARNVENYTDNSQATYHGTAMLYIQAGKEEGAADIVVSADSLQSASVRLAIK